MKPILNSCATEKHMAGPVDYSLPTSSLGGSGEKGRQGIPDLINRGIFMNVLVLSLIRKAAPL